MVYQLVFKRASYILTVWKLTANNMPSLQDQLLKAGLVDKNKANKVKKEKQKKNKVKRRGGGETDDQVKQAARLEQAKKVERDRELNRQRLAEANQKAEQAQVRAGRRGPWIRPSALRRSRSRPSFTSVLLTTVSPMRTIPMPNFRYQMI